MNKKTVLFLKQDGFDFYWKLINLFEIVKQGCKQLIQIQFC